MKENEFLNSLNDWGSILTDTYERNATNQIEVTGDDIAVAISFKHNDFIFNTTINRVTSLQINKIYDYSKKSGGEPNKFTVVKYPNIRFIGFFVYYEDLLIDGIPAEEYILNYFENNPESFQDVEIHPEKYIVMSVRKDDNNLPGEPFNYFETTPNKTVQNIKTKISPNLKNKMLQAWNEK